MNLMHAIEHNHMSEGLPTVYLARHGETAWSISGQHTGLTDLPLTERGERNSRRLGERLRGFTFTKVLTSPLKRAARTCELAGFGGADHGELGSIMAADGGDCEKVLAQFARAGVKIEALQQAV